MTQVTIYHNPKCSKSRATLAILNDHNIEPNIRLYLEQPPTAAELDELLQALAMNPEDIFRSGESIVQSLKIDIGELDGTKLIELILQHPILMQRPIVRRGNRAIIGRPPENVVALID
ncbi:MAG TPA: arsenate reductase (glutaredoxin) [Gammaproteobacteria bacterium]|nr:arsenate reductase (glutaredoxin) [Gammaproteobacteria bacterium]HIK68948.1 arsenate reductase (glutaredoxin) [Pseudomonadales bacterium]